MLMHIVTRVDGNQLPATLCQLLREPAILWENRSTASDIEPADSGTDKTSNQDLVLIGWGEITKGTATSRSPARGLRGSILRNEERLSFLVARC